MICSSIFCLVSSNSSCCRLVETLMIGDSVVLCVASGIFIVALFVLGEISVVDCGGISQKAAFQGFILGLCAIRFSSPKTSSHNLRIKERAVCQCPTVPRWSAPGIQRGACHYWRLQGPWWGRSIYPLCHFFRRLCGPFEVIFRIRIFTLKVFGRPHSYPAIVIDGKNV